MESGDEITVIETSQGVRLGVLICWDNNLTENARLTALGGADILMAPHQTGGCASRSPRYLGKIDLRLWENRAADPDALRREFRGTKGRGWLLRWLPSRAHDNGMFLMFSNGVGRDDDEVRTGGAMLIDCHGEIVAESHALEDDLVVGDFDMNELNDALGRNWIRGRRPDLYKPLTVFTGSEIDNISLKKEE
jgi:predicted amidohydrolase